MTSIDASEWIQLAVGQQPTGFFTFLRLGVEQLLGAHESVGFTTRDCTTDETWTSCHDFLYSATLMVWDLSLPASSPVLVPGRPGDSPVVVAL